MALLHSQQLAADFKCPPFRLESVEGKIIDREDLLGNKALLVAFICNHCPYVAAIEDRLISLAQRYRKSGLQTVGICSNDSSNYPDDAPSALLERWQTKKYNFPYLIDRDQAVAKAFAAVCTPDLYLFDGDGKLFYHGRLDDNWKDAAQVVRTDLANAIDAVLLGQKPPQEQIPSMGCSIKWRESSPA